MGLRLIDAVYASELARALRPIAAVYARKANDDGTACYPGAEYVAGCLGLQPSIVRRHRLKLIELGVLVAEEVTMHGRRTWKVSTFCASALPQSRGTAVPRTSTGTSPRTGTSPKAVLASRSDTRAAGSRVGQQAPAAHVIDDALAPQTEQEMAGWIEQKKKQEEMA